MNYDIGNEAIYAKFLTYFYPMIFDLLLGGKKGFTQNLKTS